MNGALKQRLVDGQLAMEQALDALDFEALPSLIEAREGDIEALVQTVRENPEHRDWARAFLDRDRDIAARLEVARRRHREKLDALRGARQVHRAYLNQGARR